MKEFNMNKFIAFVKEKHKGQLRRNGEDYFNHCKKVAVNGEIICKEMSITDEHTKDIMAACYGHDLYEDTRTDYDDVVKVSNEVVATLIAIVSDDKRLPGQWRHNAYLETLKSAPVGAHVVKLADLYDNITDAFELLQSDPESSDFVQKWTIKASETLAILNFVRETTTMAIAMAKVTAIMAVVGKKIYVTRP